MVVQRRFWITRVVIPFAILLLGVAFGIFSLSQQFFVRSLICPTEKCDSVRVSTKVLQLSWGNTIPSILVIGTLGSIADKYGRRPALAVPAFTFLAMNIIFVVVNYFPSQHTFTYLIVAEVIFGLGGEFSLATAALFSIVSDCSNAQDRHSTFALLEGVYGFGIALGQFLAGYLNGPWAFVAQSAIGASLLFVAYALPETLPPGGEPTINLKVANTATALYSFFSPPAELKRNKKVSRQILLIFLSFCLFSFGLVELFGSEFLILLDSGLSHTQIGHLGSVNNLIKPCMPFLLMVTCGEAISKNVRLKIAVLQMSLLVLACSVAATPFVIHTMWFLLLLFALSGACVVFPYGYMRGMLSALIPADQQAQMLSGVAAAQACITLLGNTVSNETYSQTFDVYPPSIFLISAVVTVLSALPLGMLYLSPPTDENTWVQFGDQNGIEKESGHSVPRVSFEIGLNSHRRNSLPLGTVLGASSQRFLLVSEFSGRLTGTKSMRLPHHPRVLNAVPETRAYSAPMPRIGV